MDATIYEYIYRKVDSLFDGNIIVNILQEIKVKNKISMGIKIRNLRHG